LKEERIAILLPCYNEEQTLAKVISDCKRQFPTATIWVFDNNSTDKSNEIAIEAGATVVTVLNKGKGNVIREMLKNIDAEFYILLDSDDTYPIESAHEMLKLLMQSKADIIIGDRLSNETYFKENKRKFHGFGNNLVIFLINKLFGAELKDIMTGFRVFNKRFAKTTPILSNGFEVETEMTLHCLDKNISLLEYPIDYRDRPEGSYSKLNTFKDGVRVLKTIFIIFKDYKPLLFFSTLAASFFLLGVLIGLPVIKEYIMYQYIYKLPSAVLATGLMIFSFISLTIGILLDTIVKINKQNFQIKYQQFS